jgi:hypothetical protein
LTVEKKEKTFVYVRSSNFIINNKQIHQLIFSPSFVAEVCIADVTITSIQNIDAHTIFLHQWRPRIAIFLSIYYTKFSNYEVGRNADIVEQATFLYTKCCWILSVVALARFALDLRAEDEAKNKRTNRCRFHFLVLDGTKWRIVESPF